MPKRGENIHKRKDGRWEGRYIISYSLEGKANYQSVYRKSYAQVKQKMSEKGMESAIPHYNRSRGGMKTSIHLLRYSFATR